MVQVSRMETVHCAASSSGFARRRTTSSMSGRPRANSMASVTADFPFTRGRNAGARRPMLLMMAMFFMFLADNIDRKRASSRNMRSGVRRIAFRGRLL